MDIHIIYHKNFITIKNLVGKICKKLNVNYNKNVIEKKSDRLEKISFTNLVQKINKELGWRASTLLMMD